MRLGLLADCAGDLTRLERALALLADQLRCDRIFFLGGGVADLEAVLRKPRLDDRDDPLALLDGIEDFLETRSGAAEDLPERIGADEPPLVRVAERGSDAYDRDPRSRKLIEMVDDRIALLVHFKGDLTKEDIANACLIFHGASPKPTAIEIGPRAFVTPGALSHGDGTVAVLQSQPPGYELTGYDLAGATVLSQQLRLQRTTKMTVR